MDFLADSIAASIAGNASSPLTSGSILFPAVSGCVGDAADDAGDVFEMFRAVVFRFAEIFGNVAAESFVDAQLDGAAADAVDAEREVEKRAEHRQEPDDADPDCGGAGVALVEQRVDGGEQGGQKIEARRRGAARIGRLYRASSQNGLPEFAPALPVILVALRQNQSGKFYGRE